ncbi:hypothetical protein [Aliikangiella coralliicola]|uniref:hypothetical protein n=1 Tax=Aliikangiella coralliicola TaxID=2592383 RepID=UPI00143D344F|nr:hypothetical protein [Aliikangiella coralliicola]
MNRINYWELILANLIQYPGSNVYSKTETKKEKGAAKIEYRDISNNRAGQWR